MGLGHPQAHRAVLSPLHLDSQLQYVHARQPSKHDQHLRHDWDAGRRRPLGLDGQFLAREHSQDADQETLKVRQNRSFKQQSDIKTGIVALAPLICLGAGPFHLRQVSDRQYHRHAHHRLLHAEARWNISECERCIEGSGPDIALLGRQLVPVRSSHASRLTGEVGHA